MSLAEPSTLAAIAATVAAVAAAVAAAAGLGRRGASAAQLHEALRELDDAQRERGARLQHELRAELAAQARDDRAELGEALARASQQTGAQLASVARIQNARIEGFEQRIARLADANEKRLGEIRDVLEQRLRTLQDDNGARLDEMRRTVDEKLHATLEQRLGESFRLVSERLEQVHRGLGEMHALAADVGDLKRVLANVKTRGIWGEVQLGSLLEQMLAPGQYAANVATVPGSAERVEFAIRLPGRDESVWLPVDAKFPREDWERLQHAHDRADAQAADEASRALESRIRAEARRIRAKYLEPPHTTDFALMFLPTEGLYAEVVRRAGLVDELQREHRVVLAGPTTLAALLNSLQMGFRTLAVERRTSEVWAVLGAVKTEFGRFGDVLARTRAQLKTIGNTLDSAEVRSRAIARRLKDVEALPPGEARALLPDGPDDGASPHAAPDQPQP